MNLGYVKIATFTPEIKVCDVDFNVKSIKNGIDKAIEKGVKLLAFPQLCITGSTAGDLFFSKTLLDSSKKAVKELAEYTLNKNIVAVVGLPLNTNGKTYNACAVISNGKVLGYTVKSEMDNCIEVNQSRYFSNLPTDKLYFDGAPIAEKIIFKHSANESFSFAIEMGEEATAVIPQSSLLAVNGARIILNLSADCAYTGETDRVSNMAKSRSLQTVCAYAYVNAGDGESSTDGVYSGYSIIAEKGEVLSERAPFDNGLNVASVDLERIDYFRNKKNDFGAKTNGDYTVVEFDLDIEPADCDRVYNKTPFIVEGEEEYQLSVQAQGLKKRIIHTNAKTVVLGLSGGLDSTLALIVAVKAVKLIGKPLKDIIAVTMPCFGTSSRTLDNSIKLAKAFGVTLKKVDITKSVRRHLKDINHLESVHDAAYENAQARERTQVLMDMANMYGGLVVGTGDLSELALGWATYNGDHMSMYAVNGSIPKTLVRHLTKYYADRSKGKLKATLLDVLDTPVSPELIPSDNDTIKQVTEDIVGPYVLHDFYLYNMLVNGFSPKKIYTVAVNSFKGEFDKETILKWLKTFTRRFFNQQFKRSCLPDGVKVTEISLSPRGAYRMPSDAVSTLWLNELENI